MKKNNNKTNQFVKGDEIYMPTKDKNFMIYESYYSENYNEFLVFLLNANMHSEENILSYRLSYLIRLGCYVIS